MEEVIIAKVREARLSHPRMGSRPMYHYLQIKYIGINKFEKILTKNNLTIKQRKKRIITTQGLHEEIDENLINGAKINNINQVIAGDITYLTIREKTYYIFTLKDMYSKRIVGLYGSERMFSENAQKTLNQAIKTRGSMSGCIHHTDAGTQYKSNQYKAILKQHNMRMSIAENCLQNGMAEQLNSIIKNEYMLFKEIKNVKDLNKQLAKIKKLINEQRPVKELGYKTPIEFEIWIKTQEKKPELVLYDFNQTK